LTQGFRRLKRLGDIRGTMGEHKPHCPVKKRGLAVGTMFDQYHRFTALPKGRPRFPLSELSRSFPRRQSNPDLFCPIFRHQPISGQVSKL
jgi:hypothetical protein